MGTHISRVKSVDLDSWTDEQLQSVLMWGNARANKYWEAKLAPGHVPSESKIENFIRTKYESKRWVMDGPMPDPSTLDAEGDDDIPLSLVKEKAVLERSASQKAAAAPPQLSGASAIRRAPQQDFFADDSRLVQRASAAAPLVAKPPPKSDSAPPPKQSKPADSLLGLDFFGTETPAQNRPTSAAPSATSTGQSRPDLKQSILSLYASAPRQQPQQQPPIQPQHASHASHGSFGGMQSASPSTHSPQDNFGGFNDAFSGLNFSSTASHPPQPQPSKNSAFAGLGNLSSQKSPPVSSPPSSSFGGGSFFDAKPKSTPQPQYTNTRTMSSSSGFGAFDSAPALPISQPVASSSSGLGDLFDFSSPAITSPPAKPAVASPPAHSSVFNLSSPQPAPKSQPAPATTSGWGSNSDAWGSNDAWSSAAPSKPAAPQAPANDFGWGTGGSGGFNHASTGQAKVAADEEFGGWSAAPPTPGIRPSQAAPKPASGFVQSEDLFSNVWE
jgi:stromal membrane-associated protein